jgi:hypothetical protein
VKWGLEVRPVVGDPEIEREIGGPYLYSVRMRRGEAQGPA